MQLSVKILFFFVLLANTLTLSRRVLPFDVYTVDIALLPLGLAVFAWALANPRSLRLKLNLIDVLFVVLMALMVISLAFSVNRSQSLTGTMDWLRLFLFYFICRLIVGTVITERTLSAQFGAMAVFLLALGLIQTVTGLPIGLLANYVGSDRGDFFWYRVSGPTPNSNMFAMWVLVFGGFLLSWALGRRRVLAFFAISSLIGVVLVATQSRGGVAGFVLITLVILWANRTRVISSGFVLGGLVLGVAAITLTLASLLADWDTPFAKGAQALLGRQASVSDFAEGGERRALLETGLDLLQSPKVFLVGCGAQGMIEAALSGSARLTSGRLDEALQAGENLKTGVHNVWIAIAVENGVFTSLVLLGIFSLFSWRVLRSRRIGDPDDPVWSGYLLAMVAWYMVVASQVYLMAARLPILLPVIVLITFAISERDGAEEKPDAAQPDARAFEL